ncbi:hypothetical protein C0Q70_08909 [Pomacea canaliculata]|uniref:Uncharacterized protein n=1 Tax=Pomacea canaliculata TaxID=400727 RepID=A0A2T7P8A7_POMCA|nr:hypothetical protein C0Q70_08909 [Pomacea canaliculata]
MIQSVPTVTKREASYLKRHTTFLSPTVVDVNKATPAACDMGSLPDPVQKLAGKGPMSFDKINCNYGQDSFDGDVAADITIGVNIVSTHWRMVGFLVGQQRCVVVCGVWCMVHGAWCMVCGVWCVVKKMLITIMMISLQELYQNLRLTVLLLELQTSNHNPLQSRVHSIQICFVGCWQDIWTNLSSVVRPGSEDNTVPAGDKDYQHGGKDYQHGGKDYQHGGQRVRASFDVCPVASTELIYERQEGVAGVCVYIDC